MTARDVENDLQAINASIDGVKTTPMQMPGYLDSVNLPCALVYPGPGEPASHSFNALTMPREWIIRLYVAEVGSGRGYDEGYHRALPFLRRFAAAYSDAERTPGSYNWNVLDYMGDSGVVTMGLHGSNVEPIFWAIEFTVMIKGCNV